MSLVSKSQALRDLENSIVALNKIINDGWNDYIKNYDDSLRVVHTPTTRATIVHDHQISRASKYASEFGYQLINLSGMMVLVIGNYAIRFKKFSGELISSNQPTKQVQKFKSQESLQGFSETYNLEAGYILNETGTGISRISLVQPSGKGINWEIELFGDSVRSVVSDIFEHKVTHEEDFEGASIRGKNENGISETKVNNED